MGIANIGQKLDLLHSVVMALTNASSIAVITHGRSALLLRIQRYSFTIAGVERYIKVLVKF